MEWITYRQAEFSLEHPADWNVQIVPGPVVTVASPDGQTFALIEAFTVGAAETPTSVLENLCFPSLNLFPDPKPEKVLPGPGGSANMFLSYRMAHGKTGRARVGCMLAGNRAAIFTTAAPAEQFAASEQTLVRIVT